jgi:hypothetical protein
MSCSWSFFRASYIFFSVDGYTGFAIHRTKDSGFGCMISISAGVFTQELTALFMSLRHIREVIQPRERCFVLTDILCSVKALLSRKMLHRTNPLVYGCKQMCSDPLWNGVEDEIMWISSHVGLEGKRIGGRTRTSCSIELCCFS